jgi:hypothetical protein
MRPSVFSIALHVLPLCLACGQDPGERFGGTVFWSPSDNTTGLTRLAFEVSLSPEQLYGKDVPEVAANTKLFTWPGLVPVATRATSVVTDGGYGPNGGAVLGMATAQFEAAEPVPDGWYVAQLCGLPSGAILPDPGAYHALPGGRRGVRLRVGSEPALWGFAICDKSDAAKTIVRFSESVRKTATTWPITVTHIGPGNAVDCGLFDDPAEPRADFTFFCSPLSPGHSLAVTVGEGIVSTSGVPVPPVRKMAALDQFTVYTIGCPSVKLER